MRGSLGPPPLGKARTQKPGTARRVGGTRVPRCVLAAAKGKADRCGGGGIRRPSPVRRTRTLLRYAPMRRGPFRGRQTGPHPHLASPSALCAGARSQRHGQCPPALAQPVVRAGLPAPWPCSLRSPAPSSSASRPGFPPPWQARPHLGLRPAAPSSTLRELPPPAAVSVSPL